MLEISDKQIKRYIEIIYIFEGKAASVNFS